MLLSRFYLSDVENFTLLLFYVGDGVVIDILFQHDIRKELIPSDGINDYIVIVDAYSVKIFWFFIFLAFLVAFILRIAAREKEENN